MCHKPHAVREIITVPAVCVWVGQVSNGTPVTFRRRKTLRRRNTNQNDNKKQQCVSKKNIARQMTESTDHGVMVS